MPRIVPPTENQHVKTVGDLVDLYKWLDEAEDIKDAKGKVVGKRYVNVPKEVRDELLKGKVTSSDINDRPNKLTSKNLEISIELARRKFGTAVKVLHEMEFVLVRPLTLQGALMLMDDQGDPLFEDKEQTQELPSVVRYFNKAWVNSRRDNANARMANIVEGMDRQKDQAIRTVMAVNDWTYERARQEFLSILRDNSQG